MWTSLKVYYLHKTTSLGGVGLTFLHLFPVCVCRGEGVRAALREPEGTPVCREHEGQRSARQGKAWDPQQLDQPHGKRHRTNIQDLATDFRMISCVLTHSVTLQDLNFGFGDILKISKPSTISSTTSNYWNICAGVCVASHTLWVCLVYLLVE